MMRANVSTIAVVLVWSLSAPAQTPVIYRDPDDPARTLTWHADVDTGTAEPSKEAPAARLHAEERPFAFVLDPTTPSAGDVTLAYALGAASGVSAERPLPATFAVSGAEQSFTIGYGLSDRVAPFASMRLLVPTAANDMARATGDAGLRWQLTRPTSNVRLTLASAVFREFLGAWGSYTRLAASYDLGRLRLAANAHAEHVFAVGRDAVDVLVLAGVSYAVAGPLRTGVEYVGQDLEESAASNGVEGGARHFLGPDVAIDLLRGQVQLVGGASMGVGGRSPPVMGRLAALTTF
jgi:hypothetical protein